MRHPARIAGMALAGHVVVFNLSHAAGFQRTARDNPAFIVEERIAGQRYVAASKDLRRIGRFNPRLLHRTVVVVLAEAIVIRTRIFRRVQVAQAV